MRDPFVSVSALYHVDRGCASHPLSTSTQGVMNLLNRRWTEKSKKTLKYFLRLPMWVSEEEDFGYNAPNTQRPARLR